jgi:hypothetical protein
MSTTSTPANETATDARPRRVKCRVKGCPSTIPYSPGYWPDGTCWRHDHLVRPATGYERRRDDADRDAAAMYERTGRREWRGTDAGDDLRAYLRGVPP